MIIEYIIIFFLAFIFIKIIQKNASTWNLVDIPNGRSTHKKHTPRGAGIGFYLAVALTIPFFHFDMILQYIWTYIAILLIFLVGLLDDHHDTKPNTKFFIIILGSVMIYFDNIVIDDIGIFFGVATSFGWFALPFTIFAVVGFTNALNLIDGLDGLAATISLVILATFLSVGYSNNDLFIIIFSSTFIVALLAFLIYNWHPASIFMGDSGSLTLGFVIAILAIKSLAYVSSVGIFFMTALPIMDTLVVMTRRKLNGRSMFSADRCHMHHVLRHFFAEDTRKTVLFLGVLQAVYSLTGLQFSKDIDEGHILILFLLNVVLLYLFFAAMIKRQNRKC